MQKLVQLTAENPVYSKKYSFPSYQEVRPLLLLTTNNDPDHCGFCIFWLSEVVKYKKLIHGVNAVATVELIKDIFYNLIRSSYCTTSILFYLSPVNSKIN
jgi:hypothetical protein